MNLLSSPPTFPPRTHLRNYQSSSSSSSFASSSSSYASSSGLLQEQRDEFKPVLHFNKDDKGSQGVLNKKLDDSDPLVHEELDRPSLHWPGFWEVSPPLQRKVNVSSSSTMVLTSTAPAKDIESEVSDAISLAKMALEASKEAASIAEDSELRGIDSNDTLPMSLASCLGKENETVKSTKLLERRSKRRKIPKSNFPFPMNKQSRSAVVRRKLRKGLDSANPIQVFLAGTESKQLLTSEEELEMVERVQELLKLEETKAMLESQFGREPTLVEWAEAVGVSRQNLKSRIRSGLSGREKLIYANLRMVAHVAKQYQGRGVGIQDLMQEGSMGLMKSIEKFKPLAGCRFASYAYWWVRQTIRKAIFQHSRTIRLPENMYTLLGKVFEAKRKYMQEGNLDPTKEEIASHVGIKVERLEKLLFITRSPISMQQPVWADSKTTFQEVTADACVEIPELSVTKKLMRKHVRSLLRALDSREKQIIKLRYGIGDGNQKSLSEIGRMYGLSKERVRQLESRALFKLKEGFEDHDLGAYSDLLF